MTAKAHIPTPGFNMSMGEPSGWTPSWVTCEVTKVLVENSGVVLLGKTNLAYYMCDWECNNPVFGQTVNPYDTTRTPGGSSGGSSAALAAGLTPLELGSDIGGSVRLPAVCCGVVGHVATRDVVPKMDVQLGLCGCIDRLINTEIDKTAWMARYGPMARTAEDVIALLDILGGDVAASLERPKPGTRLSDYRVALWRTHETCPAGRDVSKAMELAASALKAAGATVEELEFPMDPSKTYRIYLLYLSTFMKDHMSEEQKKNVKAGCPEKSYPSDMKSPFAEMDSACVNGVPEGTDEAYEKATGVWDACLKQYDAVLCPIMPGKAWKCASEERDTVAQAKTLNRPLDVDGEERRYGDGSFWAHLSALFGLPATGFPVMYSSDGLPVGLQAIGAKGNDFMVLDVVKLLMKELGSDNFQPPEGY